MAPRILTLYCNTVPDNPSSLQTISNNNTCHNFANTELNLKCSKLIELFKYPLLQKAVSVRLNACHISLTII